MLLFNLKNGLLKVILLHFNTSNVTIQLAPDIEILAQRNFNTSNVTIQQILLANGSIACFIFQYI